MRIRTMVRAAVVTGVAAWIAGATLAQQDKHALAQAFPARLLVSPESCTTPEWPKEARRYEIEGVTLMHFHIGADGSIAGARVARTSSWKLLDDAAAQSLANCRFKPGLAAAERDKTYSVQFVWTLSGPPSVHPQLVPGSCEPSPRFSAFQVFNRNATGPDGVLLRFVVNGRGVPFGVKAEAYGKDEAAGLAAAEWVKTCTFAFDPAVQGEQTDTVFGRALMRANAAL
jgi:TonB family protein